MVRRLAWGMIAALAACGDDGAAGGTEGTGGTGETTDGSTPATTAPADSSTLDSSTLDSTSTVGGSTGSDATSVTDATTDTDTGTDESTTSSDSGGVPGEDCVIHVATSGDDTASGLSWLSAKRTVPAALELAARYDCSVWIAEGEYFPTEDDDPTASFVLFAGALVYGGFAGDESTTDERDIAAHPTVLSGDLGVPGDRTDNTFHVVAGADGALLDGLVVAGGDARDELAGLSGGGLVLSSGSMTLRHCAFEDNQSGHAPPPAVGNIGGSGGDGGAIYVPLGAGDLTIEDCAFTGNRTGDGSEANAIGGNGGRGAGIYFRGGVLSVTGSQFTANTSGVAGTGGDLGGFGGDGGAIHFEGESLTVASSSFTGNVTGDGGVGGDVGGTAGSGAAISIVGGTTRIEDCAFVDNATGDGGDAPMVGAGSQIGGNGGLGGAISAVTHEGVTIVGSELSGNVTGTLGLGEDLDGGAGLGGALFLRGSPGDVLVAHCTLLDNRSGVGATDVGGGGAIAIMPSNPGTPQGATRIVGSVFAGNEGEVGGALWIRNNGLAPVDIVASSFALHVAESGGAIWYQSLDPEGAVEATLVDSILWGDTASFSSEILTNAGFVGDPVVPLVVSSSILAGGCDPASTALTCGAGILIEDPQFADAAAGDLHPLAVAPVDAGNDAALPPDLVDLDGDGDTTEPWSRDLDGNPRVAGGAVDLGPFEAP